MITHEQRANLELCVKTLDGAIESLDLSFRLMARISQDFSKEDQRSVKRGLQIIIDAMEGSLKDARFILTPLEDSSKEYTR